MAETTNISWADATLNFWIGCTEVSNGPKGACVNCYARGWGARFGVEWGAKEARRRTVHNLAKAKRLQRKAIAEDRTLFCFSNSLSDIFDNEVPIEWLRDAFDIMREAPDVTFLLLTKRPQNIISRALAAGGLPLNAAIGCTAVTQEEWDRDIPFLIWGAHRLDPALVFVSIEPMMGSIDMRLREGGSVGCPRCDGSGSVEPWGGFPRGASCPQCAGDGVLKESVGGIFAGGESGVHARPSHPDWFRGLRDQCEAAGVPFHFKQWGEFREFPTGYPGVKRVEAASRAGKTILDYATAPSWITPDGRWFRSPDHLPYETPCRLIDRVGKEAAGRLLDGVEHNARPVAR